MTCGRVVLSVIRIAAIALLFALTLCSDPWTPGLAMRTRAIGSALPSPDGRWLAWTETRAIMDNVKSEYMTQIWLGRTDGSRRFQMTQGDKSSASPQFSPDSRYVYFTSARNGRLNLFRAAIEGGEAERLTDWKGALAEYAVSPNGQWIAFAGAPDDPRDETAKKQKLDFRVIGENTKNHALWLVPADGSRPPKRIFEALYHVQGPSAYTRQVGGLDWSPDSRRIVFTHLPDPGAGGWGKADISEVDVENGSVRPVAVTARAEFQPRYSPDGRYIAYLRTADPPLTMREYRIALYTRASGEMRELPKSFDEWPHLLGWSPDGSRILFGEGKGFRNVLYAMPVDGPPLVVFEPSKGSISGGALTGVAVRVTGSRAGLILESSNEGAEAYVLDLAREGAVPVQVSAANTGGPKPSTGGTLPVAWKSPEGREIEGRLTLPVGYAKGKKYPLVLNVHGGPASAFIEDFTGRAGVFPEAVFNARGYATLRVNPRGSAGYGRDFRFANRNDWGSGPYADLMSGVDRVISMGIADPNRLAVSGWSYGGYMTSWIVTQTTRFKAAVIGAAPVNLWSMAGTTDVLNFLPDWFGGPPWDRFEVYRANSPMSFVNAVKTPALILHGELDERVPLSQGFEFYNALRRLGVTTKMVVYPRSGHGVAEPKLALDVLERQLEWVDKYTR